VKKILIINTPGLVNKGSEAVVVGAIETIENAFPQYKLTFLCHHYNNDKRNFSRIINDSVYYEVKKHPWFRFYNSKLITAISAGFTCLVSLTYCVICRIAANFGLKFKNVFNDCDFIIDLNTDALNEYYGSVFNSIFVIANILHGIILKKTVVVCAASIAPFKKKWLKNLLKWTLNKVKLITVREEYSLEHLNYIGINKPEIYLTADLAFLMPPCPSSRVIDIMKQENITLNDKPLIGIAAAPKIVFTPNIDYVSLLADVSDTLVNTLDYHVLFIPNSFNAGIADDKLVINEIYQKINYKDKVDLLLGEYSASEIKGVIGQCNLFFGAKFHPLVASTSMGIPSIGLIGYHKYKFNGVIGKMMGQQEYLINVDDYENYNDIKNIIMVKIKHIIENRDLIHRDLVVKTEKAKELALSNGILIKNFVDN